MRTHSKALRRARWIALASAVVALIFVTSLGTRNRVEANHPVLVEGNCDSPVPGTTLVSPGTCGDFDGDGRIGTAEDTDGADRIFGTINAAIGPGTGAAAGTGANHNGLVKIVASGRFAEAIYIGQNVGGPGSPGVANPGNLTLEAAPGVNAMIDAILQGDPAGGNVTRTNGVGIVINYTAPDRRVTLRNLDIRNWDIGVEVSGTSRVTIDNCRFENNLNGGIKLGGTSQTVINDTQVNATGFRTGVGNSSPTTSHSVLINSPAAARIVNSTISYSANTGIFNTGAAANVVLYKVSTFFNAVNVAGPVTICTDAAVCQ